MVETWIDLGGYSVCIADTAGIKDFKADNIDLIEREGIKRAIQRFVQFFWKHSIILIGWRCFQSERVSHHHFGD